MFAGRRIRYFVNRVSWLTGGTSDAVKVPMLNFGEEISRVAAVLAPRVASCRWGAPGRQGEPEMMGVLRQFRLLPK